MLRRLVEYADRMGDDLPPPMYKKVPIPWLVDLDKDGRLLGFVPTSSGQKKDRGKEYIVPDPDAGGKRAAGIRPNLLADRADYVLGVSKDGGDKRAYELHQAFKQLLSECLAYNKEPELVAVEQFLNNLGQGAISIPDQITASQWVTFRVRDQMPVDLPSVQKFWCKRNQPQGETNYNCIVCGASCQPTRRHPGGIKGVPDGQPAGLALVSANKKAFESYGLEESRIAPTCHSCAERYLRAINSLIKSESNRYYIGPLIYLFWTKKGGFSPVSLFSTADPEEVKALLASAARGREYSALDDDAFYATALSASGGRLVVRRWLETTVAEARCNISRWFRLQQLVDNNGGDGLPIPLFPLAASLYRDVNKEKMNPNLPRILVDVALDGGPFPDWIMFQAVKRNRADQGVTRPRAALIKMVLQSKNHMEGDNRMEKLDPANNAPAYLCGRLLAELEAVQRVAISNPNATIVDRFFGTASSAPASVFGRLLRGAQSHLGKIRKTAPGTHYALQERLEDIQAGLESFPRVLTLEQQGLFALGYYHQRAADRAAARAHKENQTKKNENNK